MMMPKTTMAYDLPDDQEKFLNINAEFFNEQGEGKCVKCGQPSAYGKRVIFGRQY